MSKTADPDGRQVFRSPGAVAIWWLWVLFAAVNLIDLAIQGRDHLSLVAGFILLAVTGAVYVVAHRPRVVADTGGLTIVNPVRVHHLGWAAIAGFETTDLLRVRCAWPAETGSAEAETEAETETETEAETGSAERKRAIYAWAVRTSLRSQMAAESRAKRQAKRASGSGFGMLGFAAPPPDNSPPPAPLGLDPATVIGALTERAEKARATAPDARAVPPLSQWHWPSVAAVVIPALALVIVILA